MEEKRTKLKEFILKYGYDFLNDGTKDKIIKKIDAGDEEILWEILQAVDADWMKRVKELGKFGIFTDMEAQDAKGKRIKKPFMKANYIDSANSNETQIPVLRRVKPRNKGYYDIFDDFEL